MKPLANTDKKKIIEQLNKQFGITTLNGLAIKFGEEKLRLYTGSLSKEDLYHLDNELRTKIIDELNITANFEIQKFMLKHKYDEIRRFVSNQNIKEIHQVSIIATVSFHRDSRRRRRTRNRGNPIIPAIIKNTIRNKPIMNVSTKTIHSRRYQRLEPD